MAREAGEDSRELRAAWQSSYAGLVAALTALTGDRVEAEDAVQDAFTRAVTAWRAGVPDNPEAWLRTVAVNIARTRWRRLRRGLTLAAGAHQPADVPGLSPDRVALLAALRRLPAAQREALVLHHLVDLPVAEVASLLGVAEGTVKARLSRGRVALGGLLDERADEPVRRTPTRRAEGEPRRA